MPRLPSFAAFSASFFAANSRSVSDSHELSVLK